MEKEKVAINLELSPQEALALAQFVKRTGWTDAREKATSDDEAYLMMDGLNVLQRALAEAGYSPR